MGLISDLTSVADDILGVRDDLGAAIHDVYILTRTWSGTEPGDGSKTDSTAQVTPTPAIKDLAHDFKAQEAGNYEQGDLILKGISKQSYPNESDIDLSTGSDDVQKFYQINGKLYQVISVKERYITWDVQIRKTTG